MLYSIVIPVYKSERSLKELYQRICRCFESIDSDFEIIMVEDCGNDNSWQILKDIRGKDKRVKIIQLMKNFGQHNALMCGLSHCRGDYAITIDDDLQNPPEEIPKLIHAIGKSNFDIVYGIPKTKKHSLFKNIGSNLYFWCINQGAKSMKPVVMSSFRVIHKNVVEVLVQNKTPNPLVGTLLMNITESVGFVFVEHHKRYYGRSTYRLRGLTKHFLNGILYQSILPLKLVFYLGIFCCILSALLGSYYLLLYFFGQIGPPGWMTIVLLILFFSGLTMFSIGIIGEYLLRIIQEVSFVPQYTIREKDL